MPRAVERRVLLTDVARTAGTSEATASRALRDDPRIGVATRAAVRAAALELGYVPNAAARSLRARETHILGLLLDDLADPVHGQVAAGFEAAAASHGYAVFIMTGLHDAKREQRALRAFVEHRADGIVLASCVSDPAEVYARVAPERVVFVKPEYPGLANGEEPPARGVLGSDDASGVAATIRHLVDRGYSRIAYIGAGGGASDLRRRTAAAAALAALRPTEPLRIHDAGSAGWRDASGMAEVLARNPPEAVVCYDDKLALTLLDALRSTRLEVPAELAIVGFDGIASAGQSYPRLTTVAVPTVELGSRAVDMLVAAARDGVMPASEAMPGRLVIRDSTPPRAAVVTTRQPAEALEVAAPTGRGR